MRELQPATVTYYISLIKAMKEESENKDKIVLYHATNAEMGFLFDVLTEVRHQLMMEGNDTKALRATDRAFIKLNKMLSKEADVHDFRKTMQVNDHDNSFRDKAIAVSIGLFGSYDIPDEAAYHYFGNARSIQPVDLRLVFKTI
jgi:hypothetical protein